MSVKSGDRVEVIEVLNQDSVRYRGSVGVVDEVTKDGKTEVFVVTVPHVDGDPVWGSVLATEVKPL